MNKIEAIEKVKSVREYMKKALSREDHQLVLSLLERPYPLEDEGNVEFLFREDGEKVAELLDGVAGYSGRMIEAPHYLVVLSRAEGVDYRRAGFIAQSIILRLMQEGIGTCWVSVESSDVVKEKLQLETDKEVAALIALGYPRETGFFEKFFSGIKASRSPYSETGYADFRFEYEKDTRQPVGTGTFIYIDNWGNVADADELERRGYLEVYHYMKYAPSWGNRRPWRFILQNFDIVMAVQRMAETEQLADHLEGGIAMYFFQLAMHEMGIRGYWLMDAQAEVPDNYFLAGKYVSDK